MAAYVPEPAPQSVPPDIAEYLQRELRRISNTFLKSSEEVSGISYQPLDADLTAIAALATTAYGRNFLTFATESAFKIATNLEANIDFDPALHTTSLKATPVDADEIQLADSAASFVSVRATLTSFKAYLKTYLDTLYGALAAAANTWSGRQIVVQNNTSGIANASGTLGAVEIQALTPFTGGAFMTFHRPGIFAAYFGLDSDSVWKVGGWSMGANAYKIMHEGLATFINTQSASSQPQIYLYNTAADTTGGYYLMRKARGAGAVNVGDTIGNIQWQAMNSTPTIVASVNIGGVVTAVAAGSVDGKFILSTTQGGAFATRGQIINGWLVGSGGTDQGLGTINVGIGYYLADVALPIQKRFESAQQTITAAGALTLAHSLGVLPKLYMAVIICQTAELGYSIGDEVQVNPSVHGSSAESRGLSLVPDATNINVRFGSGTVMDVINKTTGGVGGITAANWKLVIRAWA